MAIIHTHPGGPYYVWRTEAMGSPPPAQFDEYADFEGILYHDWQHGVPKAQAQADYLTATIGTAGQEGAGPPSGPANLPTPTPVVPPPPPPPPPPPTPPPEFWAPGQAGTGIAEELAIEARSPHWAHDIEVAGDTAGLTGTALSIAQTLLNEGLRLKAPRIALAACMCAAAGETAFGTNPNTYGYNGVCCWGVLQGGTDQWPNPHDVVGQAQAFYTGRGPQGQTDFHTGAINWVRQGVTDPEEIAVRTEVPSIWPDDAYARNAGVSSATLAQRGLAIVGALLPGLGTTVPSPGQPPRPTVPTTGGVFDLFGALNWAGSFERLCQHIVGGSNEAANMADQFERDRINNVKVIGWNT